MVGGRRERVGGHEEGRATGGGRGGKGGLGMEYGKELYRSTSLILWKLLFVFSLLKESLDDYEILMHPIHQCHAKEIDI